MSFVSGTVVNLKRNISHMKIKCKSSNGHKILYVPNTALQLQYHDSFRCKYEIRNEKMWVIDNSLLLDSIHTIDRIKYILLYKLYREKDNDEELIECAECICRGNDSITFADITRMGACCNKHIIIYMRFIKYHEEEVNRRIDCILDEKEIKMCRKLLFRRKNDLLEALYKTPLKLICLSQDRVLQICDRLSITVDEETKQHFILAEMVYNSYIEEDHCMLPIADIPECNFEINYQILEHEYDVDKYKNTLMLRYFTKQCRYLMNRLINIYNGAKHSEMLSIANINIIQSNVTDQQLQAIRSAINKPITYISGSAGSGKTSYVAINILLNIAPMCKVDPKMDEDENPYKNEDKDLYKRMLILSPTGKAASRIRTEIDRYSQLKGIKVYTVHMAMTPTVLRDHTDLEYVMIDESSMLSTQLFARFLSLYSTCRRIIFIGDINQLGPIQPGQLFYQMLKSHNLCNAHSLKQVHRASDNDLAQILQDVTLGKHLPQSHSYITYHECSDITRLNSTERSNARNILAKLYESKEDVKVISTTNADVSTLNILCKEANNQINPIISKTFVDLMRRTWNVGDPVMFTVNNYDIKVNNGDEGMIVRIENDGIIVDCNDRIIHVTNVYRDKDDEKEQNEEEEDVYHSARGPACINDIVMAYAITVNKSQGSEYNKVVIYVPRFHRFKEFLDNKRIYTALSRAKSHIHILTPRRHVNSMISAKYSMKNDNLADMIQDETMHLLADFKALKL